MLLNECNVKTVFIVCCSLHLLYMLHSVSSFLSFAQFSILYWHDRTAKLSGCVSACSHRALVPVTDYIYLTVPQKFSDSLRYLPSVADLHCIEEIVPDCIDQKLYLEANYAQNIFQRLLQLRRILSLSDSFFLSFFCSWHLFSASFYLSPRNRSDVSVQRLCVVLGLNPVTVGNWANSNEFLFSSLLKNWWRRWEALKAQALGLPDSVSTHMKYQMRANQGSSLLMWWTFLLCACQHLKKNLYIILSVFIWRPNADINVPTLSHPSSFWRAPFTS